ncbi:ChaN family lipoprotein [Halorhodospira halochloris]|uniref:ChaN family lipoprotein n=1 Tax=Halorhodospira halochloris TaxID=1052 RepID=UPI001EE7FF89|nr:ChaN family lipoprotein [Halorhodospira halochloris]MCG5530478.1 ChaN family lipoprotein [Halorhodospira halochloris]
MRQRSIVISTALAASTILGCGSLAAEPDCSTPGTWYSTEADEELSTAETINRLGDASYILLGERHDSSEHHRWQLHMLSGLLGKGMLTAVGFEMFPRSSQAAVDSWIDGQLTEDSFLSKSNWDEVWGFEPELYMPLFHFVRMHQIPSQAINVDRATVRKAREIGLDELSSEQREGVSKPADPLEDYQQQLAEVLERHPGDIDQQHFIEAQTFWDRAMAEGLKKAHDDHGAPVAGIVGMGHAQYGHGIPFQLNDLGHDDVVVLLPHEAGQPCPQDNRADYLFVVATPEADDPEPPRMGVGMELDDEELVKIVQILSDSPAADAGIATGDRVIKAAGEKITHPRDLQQVVQKQPHGTWLPLLIERDGEQLQKIIKFPREE